MIKYLEVRRLSLIRFVHLIIPIKHKLNFLIQSYLNTNSILAIRYFRKYYICTKVTDLNRKTIGELILEGVRSQPESFLIKK